MCLHSAKGPPVILSDGRRRRARGHQMALEERHRLRPGVLGGGLVSAEILAVEEHVGRLFVDVHLEVLAEPLHVSRRRRDPRREAEIVPAEERDHRRLDPGHDRFFRRSAVEHRRRVDAFDFRRHFPREPAAHAEAGCAHPAVRHRELERVVLCHPDAIQHFRVRNAVDRRARLVGQQERIVVAAIRAEAGRQIRQHGNESLRRQLIGDGPEPVRAAAAGDRLAHVHAGSGLEHEDDRRPAGGLRIRDPSVQLHAARHRDVNPFALPRRAGDGASRHQEVRGQVRTLATHAAGRGRRFNPAASLAAARLLRDRTVDLPEVGECVMPCVVAQLERSRAQRGRVMVTSMRPVPFSKLKRTRAPLPFDAGIAIASRVTASAARRSPIARSGTTAMNPCAAALSPTARSQSLIPWLFAVITRTGELSARSGKTTKERTLVSPARMSTYCGWRYASASLSSLVAISSAGSPARSKSDGCRRGVDGRRRLRRRPPVPR